MFNSAYEDLLTTFNQQKSTYHVLGNELRILEKMGEFLEEFLEDKDPKQKKTNRKYLKPYYSRS